MLLKDILVYMKPEILYFWAPTQTSEAVVRWNGLRKIRLVGQRNSLGGAAASPATGISYIAVEDTLVITLLDGSIHKVWNVRSEPTLNAEGGGKTPFNQLS